KGGLRLQVCLNTSWESFFLVFSALRALRPLGDRRFAETPFPRTRLSPRLKSPYPICSSDVLFIHVKSCHYIP
ncbi:hypothetical protein B0H17DRAFT_1048902, partial [Mycena rosella]